MLVASPRLLTAMGCRLMPHWFTTSFLATTVLALLFVLPDGLMAADPATAVKEGLLPKQKEVVRTTGGVNLHFTYYPSRGGKDSPVVILLHMKDSNQFVWQDGFAERLQALDYAVVTVDLRGHGESKGGAAGVGPIPGGNVNQPDEKAKAVRKPTSAGPRLKPADYQAMPEDLESLKREFLFKEHQAMRLNMAKMGVVGPEMGATIAAYYANVDWNLRPYDDGAGDNRTPRGQDVKALVLISPVTGFEGMNIVTPLQSLRNPQWNLAFLVCYGANDPQDKGQAQRIYQSLKPAKNETRMYFKSYPTKLRGTDLLGKGFDLEARMEAFFKLHLKNLDIPWRDRRPKYDREK